MNWDEFWKLIDSGVGDPQGVVGALKTLPEAELVEFFWTYKELVGLFLEEQYADQVADPYSEDTHKDIAEWVIAQGNTFHEDIAYHPEKFPPSVPDGGDRYDYLPQAANIYHDRFGQEIRLLDEPPPT